MLSCSMSRSIPFHKSYKSQGPIKFFDYSRWAQYQGTFEDDDFQLKIVDLKRKTCINLVKMKKNDGT